MNGYLVLAYNNTEVNRINLLTLDIEINKRNYNFFKGTPQSTLYDTIIGYQFLKKTDEVSHFNPNHFLSGDLYGNFMDFNDKELKYNDSIKLISSSSIEDDHILLEGNATVCSVFNEKIIFQNDLEGHRKIYYFRNEDVLCISTHLPLLLNAVKNSWNIRKNAVIGLLSGRESKWPLTFFENIFVLPPLSRAEVTKKGIKITSKFYSDLYVLGRITKNNLQDQLYDRYKLTALRKKNNKIAVTLSGGFDSNCLTKLYSKISKDNITAVSVGYVSERTKDGNVYNETIYAEKVAQKLNIPFKGYIFNNTEFFNCFDNFIETIDQPGHDPSSNFIMNKYLNKDGFQLVVNGMGGDANYSYKPNLILGLKLYNFALKSRSYKVNTLLGKLMSYRGPFAYFQPYLDQKDIPNSFQDLFERNQLFGGAASKYISMEKKVQIDKEREYRRYYFDKLYKEAKTVQEILYSLALFCSPDEYHATLMAERNELDIIMPFTDTKAALLVMNGSHYNKIVNREFEMSIFGGIESDLLVKGKSGFSIPYSEWLHPFANSIFEYYLDLKYFSKDEFDIQLFRNQYLNDIRFSQSSSPNMILWKLYVIKEYIRKNGLGLL